MAIPNTNTSVNAPAKSLLSTTLRYAGKMATAIFLAVLLLTTVLAGLVSLLEGATCFLKLFTSDKVVAYATQQMDVLRANPTKENIREVSIGLWGLSKLVSVPHFTYSKLPEQGLFGPLHADSHIIW